jgi:hypothetical protein
VFVGSFFFSESGRENTISRELPPIVGDVGASPATQSHERRPTHFRHDLRLVPDQVHADTNLQSITVYFQLTMRPVKQKAAHRFNVQRAAERLSFRAVKRPGSLLCFLSSRALSRERRRTLQRHISGRRTSLHDRGGCAH